MLKKLAKLSYMVPVIALSIGSATIATSSAEAAGHFYCVNYANTAVSQQNRNFFGGCGFASLRWHSAWNLHYQWCKGVQIWRGNSEIDIREGMLNGCGA